MDIHPKMKGNARTQINTSLKPELFCKCAYLTGYPLKKI